MSIYWSSVATIRSCSFLAVEFVPAGTIPDERWEAVEGLCAPHRGMRHMQLNYKKPDWFWIECRNGQVFSNE